MKKGLYKLFAVVTALAVLTSVPLSLSAKSQNGNSEKKSEVKLELKQDKKVQAAAHKKTETKPEIKQDKKTYHGKEIAKAKKPAKINPALEKLNTVDKKINSVEIELDKLTVKINSVVSITTGSAISTTGNAIAIPNNGAVPSTTGSAITVKLPKGQSLKGFVNGNKGKLNALTNRVKAIEKTLKVIKTDKITAEKYNSITIRLNTIKTKIQAEIKLLNSLLPKK